MVHYIALVNNRSGYYLCTFLDTFFLDVCIYGSTRYAVLVPGLRTRSIFIRVQPILASSSSEI